MERVSDPKTKWIESSREHIIAFEVVLKQAVHVVFDAASAGKSHFPTFSWSRLWRRITTFSSSYRATRVVIDRQEDPPETHEARGSDPWNHQVRAQPLVTLRAAHSLPFFGDSQT